MYTKRDINSTLALQKAQIKCFAKLTYFNPIVDWYERDCIPSVMESREIVKNMFFQSIVLDPNIFK